MITLGINGGLDFPYENEFNFQSDDMHDAAAALVVDGKLVSAIEEERLNRIKHSNKTSLFSAARFVLDDYGITINDVDALCYYLTEETCNGLLKMVSGEKDIIPVRKRLAAKVRKAFDCDFDEKKIRFVHHHLAHAVSTVAMSGFDNCLVMSIDGSGDNVSVMVLKSENGKLDVLDTIDRHNSLGRFYTGLIKYLGFKNFDEYKVMGLAPYGNPAAYRDVLKSFYKLLPNGRVQINREYFNALYRLEGIPRKKTDPFTKVHKDLAAGIQDALEMMVLHIVKHYKAKYNHTKLCLAGGVAQNCTVNGKLLYSGMFEDIFVQPASYDAGTSIGAALYTYYTESGVTPKENPRLEHVYFGTDIGGNDTIGAELENWKDLVDVEKCDNITQRAAQLLANGSVIGWTQGRSEFGPRALGNRSILADPRPVENKDVINAMVKKREAFRPFAPSVLDEYVEEYYVVPDHIKYKKFPFMTFVLDVQKDKQKILGATTHVDGTSRIQSVSKETNPKYWEVIDEFRKLTGIPLVLNTSFNNNVEPIVNTVQDSLVCYLTTKLNYLVIGDYLISKKDVAPAKYMDLIPSIPLHVGLHHSHRRDEEGVMKDTYEIRDNMMVSDNRPKVDAEIFSSVSYGLVKSNLSGNLYGMLCQSDGKKSFKELSHEWQLDKGAYDAIGKEIFTLWALRLVRLTPAPGK